MKDIDAYAKFTEEIWFSKHQNTCAVFVNSRLGHNNSPDNPECDCDQDAERSLAIMTLGLAGETGEVMELLKKRIRDGKFDKQALIKELGDVAYYWARICKHFEVYPSEVLETNITKLLDRKARGKMQGSGNDR